MIDSEEFDIFLGGVMVRLTFQFTDLSRMPNGEGWRASTRIPPPLDRTFEASGLTRDEATERLIGKLHDSPDVGIWAQQTVADADEEHRDPSDPRANLN